LIPEQAEQRAVDEALRSTLAAGRRPSLRSTATVLAVSPRTLQRRLDECGVTFSTMLARAETRRACDLLRDSLRPIREVSAALGYRDPSSFSRAFRQWTGVSPREYRNALGR
jgi:AraC-like DNA-binding protein